MTPPGRREQTIAGRSSSDPLRPISVGRCARLIRAVLVVATVALAALGGSATAGVTSGEATTVVVSLSPATLAADGASMTTATALVTDAHGIPVEGQDIEFSSDDPGNLIGAVVESEPGEYTSVITSSATPGKVTIEATDAAAHVFGQAILEQQAREPASSVRVFVEPGSITADGVHTATATAILTDGNGNRVPGQEVVFSTSDAGELVGSTSAVGNGVYTALITSSTKAGPVSITAEDLTPENSAAGSTTLDQTAGPAATVRVELSPSSIVADGTSSSLATARVTDAHGNPVSGDTIKWGSSDEGEQLGGFTAGGEPGTYQVTITSSTTVGGATITAEDFPSGVAGHALLTQTQGQGSTVAIRLSPSTVLADGVHTTTATATVTDAEGHPVTGELIAFSSSDPGNVIGPVTDHGDGTYSAVITSSTTVGAPEIRATDTESGASEQAKLTQTHGPAAHLGLALKPASIPADGVHTTTATAAVTDAEGHPVTGELIALASSDPGSVIGPVTDHGDGSYSALITSSTTAGMVQITATDTSVPGEPSQARTLTQAPGPAAHLGLVLEPASVPADGVHTTTATAAVTDAHGNRVPGDAVSFKSSDPGDVIGPVTDHGDGSYSALITSSTTAGMVQITATDRSVGGEPSEARTLTQAPGHAAHLGLVLEPASVLADGVSTATAVAAVTDAHGNRVPGDAVSFKSSDPGDVIGPVTDHGDGSYSALITSSTTAGMVQITATDTSVPGEPSEARTLTQAPGHAAHLGLVLEPASVLADGVSTATAVAAVTDAHGNRVPGDAVSFKSSDPGDVIGPVTDHGDGTYSALVTSSTTAGMAQITATDTSVPGKPSEAKTLTQTQRPPGHLKLSLAPSTVVADGVSTTIATATVTDAGGHPLTGGTLKFSSSDSGNRIGSVTNHGDGTYTALITSSETPAPATITASDTSAMPELIEAATLTQTVGPPVSIIVSLMPSSLVADGTSTAQATIEVRDAEHRDLPGQEVELSTPNDAGIMVGPVEERGPVYYAVLTSSLAVHEVTVTAADTSVSPAVMGSAALTQTAGPAAHVGLALSPGTIAADGASTSTATAIVTDAAGNRLAGDAVSFQTSDPADGVQAILDEGNGVYSAQIVSSVTAHTVTVTATVISAMPQVSGSAYLIQAPVPQAPSGPPSPPATGAKSSSTSKGSCRVPKLLGMSRARALRRLRAAHCTELKVHFRGRSGVVLSQTIRPATVVASKAKLSLTLGHRRGAHA